MNYKVLSLFSGGLAGLCDRGIGLAGLSHKFKVKQFIEYVPYRQHLLRQNFPGIDIWDDIRTYTTEPGTFDIICGGSPCQNNSMANPKRNGLHGDRSGLWWEMHRLISECRPRIILWENPAGCRYPTKDDPVSPLGYVLWSLEQIGYSAQWTTISASELGAPHKRDRTFVIAHPNDDGKIRRRAVLTPWDGSARESITQIRNYDNRSGINTEYAGMDDGITTRFYAISRSGWWQANPFEGEISATVRTIPNRAKRVAMIGDCCTPQQSSICWEYINYLFADLYI